MGIDYSYKLFFQHDQLWDVLSDVGTLIHPNPDEQTVVDFPDRELVLPMPLNFGEIKRIQYDDPMRYCDFNLTIYFELDDAILQYYEETRKHSEFEDWELPTDEQERVGIGYIYLYIYRDLNIYSRKDYDPSLIMLDFRAATNNMSLLFGRSTSIRRTFVHFSERNKAIYSLLNRDNDAVAIWWHGKETFKVIPDSWLSQEEITEIMRGA